MKEKCQNVKIYLVYNKGDNQNCLFLKIYSICVVDMYICTSINTCCLNYS